MWWVGEFTSWPVLKKRTRRAAATLRSAEILHTTLRAAAGQPGHADHTAEPPDGIVVRRTAVNFQCCTGPGDIIVCILGLRMNTCHQLPLPFLVFSLPFSA